MSSRQGAPRRGSFLLRLARLGLAAVVLLAGAPTAAVGAGRQDSSPGTVASLAPESAVMFFEADLDLESAQWRQARELLGRAGLPNAVEDLERTVLGELDVETTDRALDLDPFYGGEVGIVVSAAAFAETEYDALSTPGPSAAAAPASGSAAMLRPGDPDAAWAVVEEQFAERAASADVSEERIEYHGVTIRALPEAADYSSSPQAIARLDDHLLIAEVPADLEPIIDTARSGGAALADFAPMAEVRDDLNPETVLFGFVNGERLAEAVGPEARAYLDAVNPDGPGGDLFDVHAGVALWADEPGFRVDAVARPLPGGTLFDLPDNRETTGDERVSADSLVFAAGNDLGASGVLDVVALAIAEGVAEEGEATPGESVPGGATPGADLPGEERETAAYVEERFAAAERLLGVDLREDLFDRLAGEYLLSVSVSNFFALGAGVGAIFASDTEGPEKVAGGLRALARFQEATGLGLDVAARRVGEGTVYVVRDPDSTATPRFEFGVVREQAVVGAGPGLDDYLAGPGKPLAEDEQYRRVMATLPEAHNQLLYVDLTQVVPLLGLSSQPSTTELTDADPACVDHATQEDAQAAYEGDPIANGALDQDFDDAACEDFFGAATPAASPVAVPDGSPDAIEAFAAVVYEGDGLIGASAILYLAEP